MTANNDKQSIPVVDVDQAFPTMVDRPAGTATATIDQGPAVRTVIRNVLGVRSRREDPKAFVDALTASFRLVKVEGHTESQYVPRGYAIQADLGAVSGGQASLYRRATIARAEILRILDGLTTLRSDGDLDDMEAYRVIVRNSVQSLVDEMGLPGGPRVAMVDSYFAGLVGRGDTSPDKVTGQLGALRDRFGLTDDNVNTIEEEGRRTAFWTLVDLVRDLRSAWRGQRKRFTGTEGSGFLGTELIHVSRLMDAAADQVEELEGVLDSVLIGAHERQTIPLDDKTNLTLDGLLSWLSTFLHDEGRRLAQDAGRDGIVSALAPTAVALADTFKRFLADPILPVEQRDDDCCPVRYLPASCCHRWPPGMYAARVQVAVASLCRLLMELARRALRIGRWAGVVLIDITVSLVDRVLDDDESTEAVNVEFRGYNLRSTYEPAFVPSRWRGTRDDCRLENLKLKRLVRPIPGTTTADDESISALFRVEEVAGIMKEAGIEITRSGVVFPASDAPCSVVDTEIGRPVCAPSPSSWPNLVRADDPRRLRVRRKPATHATTGTAVGAAAPSGSGPHAAAAVDLVSDRPLGWLAAQRRQADPRAAADDARTALEGFAEVHGTIDDLMSRAYEDEAVLAVSAGEAEAEVQEARDHHAALVAAIAQHESAREALHGAKRGAETTKIQKLTAQAEALEGEIQVKAAAADAAYEEHARARDWLNRLRGLQEVGAGVDRYLRERLASVTAQTDEEGE